MNSQDKNRQLTAFESVIKNGENAQRSQLLELAMDWNCIDVAKELILESSLNNILVGRIYFSRNYLFFFSIQIIFFR